MSSEKVLKANRKSKCSIRECVRDSKISNHLLPKQGPARKNWLEKLQLPTDCSSPIYVCQLHFVDKDYAGGEVRKRLHPLAVPSVNLPHDMPIVRNVESSSDEEMDIGSQIDWESSFGGDEFIIHIDTECEKEPISDYDNQFFCESEAAAFKYHDQATQTNANYSDKSSQANLAYDELIKPWTLLSVLTTDSDLQSWTGIPSFTTLNNIVKCIEKLQSAQDQLKKFRATPKLLTVFVMVKLKTDLTFKQLACLFAATPKTLATYFDKFIPILKAVLEPVIFWPTKEQVRNNLPKCFKPDFEDCYFMMDCTETRIEKLKSLESQIKTYSYYKGCHTGKIIILTAPAGIVIYVSKTYGGKASDKFIVIKEKSIEKVSAGSGIMVDKGYDIRKETSSKGVKLYRPPILDKPQLSKEEATYNTNVATARIHVERVIQRLKIFNVFQGKMNKSMLKHIDDIVFIGCAITNLSASILADDKF